MKKIVIIIALFFTAPHVFSQNGFACDMKGVDTLLTPTETCILECVKKLPFEKYLGQQNMAFFDSLINCSYKKVILIAERAGYYYTTIAFSFSDNLQIRFYVKKLQYGNKKLYNAKKKWNPQLADKEIPYKVKIFHFITPICEVGSLEN